MCLYCTMPYCITSQVILLGCIILYYIVLYSIVLYWIATYCLVFFGMNFDIHLSIAEWYNKLVLYCILLHRSALHASFCIVLCYIVLYLLYCIVLYCIVLYRLMSLGSDNLCNVDISYEYKPMWCKRLVSYLATFQGNYYDKNSTQAE